VSSVVAQGPVPLSRVWAKGRVIAEDLTGEDLSDVLQHNGDASAWWVLPRDPDYGAAELRDVASALDLDDLAIHDLLATDRRAKFEAIGGARLVITNYVTHDPASSELTVHPISMIATDRVLICLVADHPDFQPARLLQQRAEALSEGGVEKGLQLVITAVINTYESAVQWIEDSTDDLSDALFGGNPLGRSEQLDAFKVRTALTQLRRVTEPMRAVMRDIVDDPPPVKGKAVRSSRVGRRWTLIAEQHHRVAGAADALREVLGTVFDTSLALADVRMNAIMKKLTGWAAIIAVPTLITGFAGMNVAFPLAGSLAGFWFVLAITVIVAVVLFLGFRRRDWI
jgi:magnesium transporter